MAVFMELAPGDTLVIGQSRIVYERKSGQRARLKVDSHEDVERIKAGEPVPERHAASAPASMPTPRPQEQPFLKRRTSA
jgi:hypothetical protein